MKNSTPLLLLFFLASPTFLFSQSAELSNVLKQLSENVQSVEAKKYSYGQALTWDENRPWQIHFESSRADEKGKTATLDQDFNLRYLDDKSIRRDNVKDLLVVRVYVKGKNKYVKNIKDGELDKYESEVEFIANDVDNARDIEALLKKAIPMAQQLPSEYALPGDYEGQLNWLIGEVTNIEIGEEQIEQKMQREDKQPSRLVFESVSQSKKGTDTEQWSFNLIDLDAKNIDLKVDKTKLFVSVSTTKDKSYIRYLKNSKLENYQEDFKIYVENIEKGKAMADAISVLAEESVKRFSNKSVENLSLSELIQKVIINDDEYEQSIRNENCRFVLNSIYSKKEETVTDEYKVNFADLDPRSVKIEVSKDEVMVTAQVIKKEKLVQLLRNGSPEGFDNELQIRAGGIENARTMTDALAQAITNCKGQNECQVKSGDVTSLMKAIAGQLGEISIKSTVYQQTLQQVVDNPDQWEYIRIEDNGKKTKQETFIFNVSDLNIKATDYKMGKEAIEITLQTKQKEEIIKYLVDDKADDYKKEMEWLVKDVETMRAVVCALQASGEM